MLTPGLFQTRPARSSLRWIYVRPQLEALEDRRVPSYMISDLGVLPGGLWSYASDINDMGQIVGDSYVSGSTNKAFVYTRRMTQLCPNTKCITSAATAISDGGKITGWAEFTDNPDTDQPFVWSNGVFRKLEIPPGLSTQVFDINDADEVVGNHHNGISHHATLWQGTTYYDLGTLGGNTSLAYAINAAGVIVGNSNVINNGPRHAFRWSVGTMSDLGTLGGNASYAVDVNSSGDVVGYSTVPGSGNFHAALWHNDGVVDLGTFRDRSTYPTSMNDYGQIVGYAGPYGIDQRAVILRDTGWIDLDKLIPPGSGWVLLEAMGINNAGQIVGYGISPNGGRAFLMTPIRTPPIGSLGSAGVTASPRGYASTLVGIGISLRANALEDATSSTNIEATPTRFASWSYDRKSSSLHVFSTSLEVELENTFALDLFR